MKRDREYAKQYEAQPVYDEKGKKKGYNYIYNGYYYDLLCDDAAFQKLKKCSLIVLCLLWLLFLFAGLLLNTPGMRSFYVLLPFVGMFLPLFFMLLDTMTFLKLKEPVLTEKQVNLCFSRNTACALWVAVLSCISFLGDLLFLVLHPDACVFAEIPFLACTLACGIISFLFYRHKKTFKAKKRTLTAQDERASQHTD